MGSESRNEKQDDLKLKQKECLSQAFCGMKWMQYSGLAKPSIPSAHRSVSYQPFTLSCSSNGNLCLSAILHGSKIGKTVSQRCPDSSWVLCSSLCLPLLPCLYHIFLESHCFSESNSKVTFPCLTPSSCMWENIFEDKKWPV